MLRLRWLFPLLGLCSATAVACSGDGETAAGGAGGAGGAADAPGGAGSGGEPLGEGGGCASDGSAAVVVEISGLPTGVLADVLIEGPDDLAVDEAGTLEGVAAGAYKVTAARVFDEDPIVRTVYDASVKESQFCLEAEGSRTIEVTYTAIPSSNKLWMPTAADDELAGFASELLADSGSTPATVLIDGPAGGAVAFDRDGNLWSFGPTVADPHVVRFAAADLGDTGSREPDISINVPEVACIPAMRSLAFDAAGNLWLSVCGDQIMRLAAADLTGSGDKVSDVLIDGLIDNEGLAFDAAGNLWVAGGPALVRYDAARLSDSTGDAPDLALSLRDALDTANIKANHLAFDADGNLWGSDFGANWLLQVAEADLAGVGEQAALASVSIAITVTALLNAPAFDDGGGLWFGLDSGHIGRLSPAQLAVSTGPGSPVSPEVLIDTVSVGSDLPVAFFPAPAGLPLFHSLP